MGITPVGVGLILLICASLTFSAAGYGQQELKVLQEQEESAAVIESLEEEMAVVMGDETAVMQPKRRWPKTPKYRSLQRRANNKPFKKARGTGINLKCSDPKLADKELDAMQLPGRVTKAIKDYLLADQSTTGSYLWVDCDARKSLALYDLMQMINSMFRDEWGDYPKIIFEHIVQVSQSFAYLPGQQNCNPKFYKSSMNGPRGSGNPHATGNHKDSEMFLTQECPAVKVYWSAWTPCRLCVHSLIAWKQVNHPNEAVAIHVATLYVGKYTDKDMTLNCLALMMKKGFIFRPWSWQTFARQARLTGKCAELVELIPHCKEFQVLDWRIKKYLKQAKHIAKWSRSAEDIKALCPDPRA